MMTKKMQSDITDIKVAVGKIQQHLSDMNSKLVACQEHDIKTCPENRNAIYKKFNKLNTSVTRNTVIISIAQAVIIGILVASVTGIIHI